MKEEATQPVEPIGVLCEQLQLYERLALRNRVVADIRKKTYTNCFTPNGFVCMYGHRFEPSSSMDYKWGPIKQCFVNALNLVSENPELVYVEGYVLSMIPIYHAWCVTRDGTVVDNTLRDRADAFVGIPLRTGFVVDYLAESESGCILDDWLQRWPVVWGRIPLAEIWHPAFEMGY